MKLSCTPISFRKQFTDGQMDIPRFIETCARLGCSAIDTLSTHHYAWFWQNALEDRKHLRHWLTEAGLALAAHGCGNNFALADAQARSQQIAKVQACIIEAAELGAPALRIFGGSVEPDRWEYGMGSHVGIPLVMEGIEQCLPVAEKHGVVLALENHCNLPGHSHELAGIIEYFASPKLRCTFDMANFMGHMMDEPEDPLHAVARLLPYIAHVHVKDNGPPVVFKHYKAEAYVAGQGRIPIRQLAAKIEASDYAGYYSLEYEAGFKVPEEQGVAESLGYMRSVAQLLQTLKDGQNARHLAQASH